MKRIKAACITQTLCFSNHDGETTEYAKKAIVQEYEKYKAQLEKGGTKYKIWLINQVKVIYWMHKKRNRVELQFCFHTVF